jgi:hypothetical protein
MAIGDHSSQLGSNERFVVIVLRYWSHNIPSGIVELAEWALR